MIRTALLLATAAGAVTPAEKTPAAARAAVVRYYAAIERGDLRTAYRMWDHGGQDSGKTFDQFRQGFARTAHTRVVAAPARDQEGAAGSSFITVPVQVYATLKTGARQHFAGAYVLRRVNDVTGATDEQLRWHLNSAKLRLVR